MLRSMFNIKKRSVEENYYYSYGKSKVRCDIHHDFVYVAKVILKDYCNFLLNERDLVKYVRKNYIYIVSSSVDKEIAEVKNLLAMCELINVANYRWTKSKGQWRQYVYDLGIRFAYLKSEALVSKINKFRNEYSFRNLRKLVLVVCYCTYKNKAIAKQKNFEYGPQNFINDLKSVNKNFSFTNSDLHLLKRIDKQLSKEELFTYRNGDTVYKFFVDSVTIQQEEERRKREEAFKSECEPKRIEYQKYLNSLTYFDVEWDYLEKKKKELSDNRLWDEMICCKEKFIQDFAVTGDSYSSFHNRNVKYFENIDRCEILEKHHLYPSFFNNISAYCSKINNRSSVKYIVSQPFVKDYKNLHNLFNLLLEEKSLVRFCLNHGQNIEIFINEKYGSVPFCALCYEERLRIPSILIVIKLFDSDVPRDKLTVVVHDVDRDILKIFEKDPD